MAGLATAVAGVVAAAFWVMLPAYVPNNAAVLVGGGPPLDGGRTLGGERLLGDGKTWRGTAGGIAAGVIVALALNAVRPAVDATLGFAALPSIPPAAMVALPTGALLGDVAASFCKRRTGRERGAAFPGVDQLDFVVGALLVTVLAAPSWFLATFTAPIVAVIVLVTPVLHVGTNVVAYRLGLKDEPW